MRIGVVNNLRAGRNRRRVERMLAFLKDRPDVVHTETDRGEHVPEALALLAQKDVDILAVNGGDGTLQRTLTEILGNGAFPRPPLIAPLRGGRTNMSALDIGSRRDPVAALAALIEASRNGGLAAAAVERAVLRVEIEPEATVLYGMGFGVGLIHRAVELTHRLFPEGRAQGVFGSGVVLGTLVARAVLGRRDGILQPDYVTICADRQQLEREQFLLVVATTLDRLFLGVRPFWGTEGGAVRFTAVASDAVRPYAAALPILYGRPPAYVTPETGYTSRNLRHLELRLDCGLTVDGEMIAPARGRVVRVSADDRLRFLRTR